MRGLLLLLAGCGLALPGLAAPAGLMRPGTNAVQPRPVEASGTAAPAGQPASQVPEEGTDIRFYGHGFLYLTTSSGVRIAFNPFPQEPSIGYPFPAGLPADIVLISAEAADLSANEGFAGLPQVFRSLTGLGVNNANGIQFRGVATYRDGADERNPRGNTAYVLELDRVTFAVLGAIGQKPDARQAKELGRADVLFLPVGNPALSVADLWQIVAQVRARWVVPVLYRTPASAAIFSQLRSLDEFWAAPESAQYPCVRLEAGDYVFTGKNLPKETTLLIYPSP
jgi:L-ascorbate metabolism protein UlaG (beta-lactamase superfamily)